MNLKKNIFGRTDFIDREGCGGARERRRWGREERLGGGSFVWVLSVSVEVDCLLSSVKRRRKKKTRFSILVCRRRTEPELGTIV